MFSLKFDQVGCKRLKSYFLNKYCDMLVNASFTKFTGPAKLFLNNIIIYLKIKKNCDFCDFLVLKPARRSIK